MIPKIIHYCWLSDDAMPDLVLRCINSWKEKLPDYELILWDKKRFDLESLTWTKQAYDAKKYAFAALPLLARARLARQRHPFLILYGLGI